jgi:hypothetical protein
MSASRAVSLRAPIALTVATSVAGVVAIAVGLGREPTRIWTNLLVDGFYVLSVALGGMLFIAVQHLSGAAWSAGMRRVAEALMCALPVAAVMMLALFFGRGSLYAWAGAAPVQTFETLASAYFAVPFVFSRMAFFLMLWMVFARLMRRASSHQDTSADPIHHQRMVRYSAIFVVVFAFSFSLACVDWLLTLDPRWTSTMYAVYVFSGVLVEGVAAVTLVVVLLHEHGHLGDVVNTNHLHDLGKLLFAFTSFWAYIWLSQYLLIWYGNLPEEAGYYLVRTGTGWLPLFVINLVVNWLIPFCLLLPRASKRSPSTLKWVAVLVLIGRWLDIYLLVSPQTMKAPALGLVELSLAAAYAGLAWHTVSGALERRPLVIEHDPHLFECLQHHQ